MIRRRNDIVIVKRAVPKVVILFNGRRFTVRCKRATKAPLYSKLAGKVKNKKLKRTLQFDITNTLSEKGTTYARNRLDYFFYINMNNLGMTNVEI